MQQSERGRRSRIAWGLWALFAVVVVIAEWESVPPPGDVCEIYWSAGGRWWNGEELYAGTGHEFNYLPMAAALWSPFSLLSYPLGAAAWRLVNLAIFVFGVRALSRSAGERSAGLFLPATAVSILLAWSAARHGQATLSMGGLMMLAATSVAARRWWRAGLQIAASVAIKPLSGILLVVGALAHPRFVVRGAVALAALTLALFALQRPGYVWAQVSTVPETFVLAANREGQVHQRFFNLFSLLESWGLGLPTVEALGRFQPDHLVRVAAIGALALLFVVLERRRIEPRAFYLYGLSAAFLLLLNPLTENNTYALIAPGIGMSLGFALQREGRGASGGLRVLWIGALVGLIALFAISRKLSGGEFGGPESTLKPLATLLFALGSIAAALSSRPVSEPDARP